MNYLTNYYRNLSEQLQEKVNYLENLILEYKKKPIEKVDIRDVEVTGEDVPMLHGRIVTKRGNPAGKGAAKEKNVTFYPGMGSMPNYSGNDEEDAWEIIRDTGNPTVENNPIYASMKGKGEPQEVRADEIRQKGLDRVRGHSVPGTGQKVKKKNLAIALAKIAAERKAVDPAQKHDTNPTDNIPVYGNPNA
jgi:hypothetical protein